MENLAGALRDPRVKIFEAGGDITQTDILDAALKGADGVLPFRRAVAASVPRLSAQRLSNSTSSGTFNVLDGCVRNGVKRLVWSSSASVTATLSGTDGRRSSVQQQELLRRDQDLRRGDGARLSLPLRPRLCRSALHECVRPAAGLSRRLYRGDHEDARRHRPGRRSDYLRRWFRGFRLRRGGRLRTRQYLRDESDRTDRFYNVGTGKRTSLKEIAEKLIKLTGSNQPIKYAPRSQATLGAQSHRFAESARPRRLASQPQIDLDEGLRRLIDWRRAHIDAGRAARAGKRRRSSERAEVCAA